LLIPPDSEDLLLDFLDGLLFGLRVHRRFPNGDELLLQLLNLLPILQGH
jgi:hypothetical protein